MENKKTVKQMFVDWEQHKLPESESEKRWRAEMNKENNRLLKEVA